VHVDVVGLAVVDAFPHLGVAAVGEAEIDAVGFGEGAVELGAGGGAGKDADLEVFALLVEGGDAMGEGGGDGLGVAGAGETAHAEDGSGLDEGCCFVGAHHALRESGVQDSGAGGGHCFSFSLPGIAALRARISGRAEAAPAEL
jgi:hypothetical protein